MIRCWEEGVWDIDMGDSCTAYGGCEYLLLCSSQQPYDWIEPNYKYEPFDPLLRGGGNI